MNVERAWAAGFFEGEGCVTANSNKPRRTIRLTIGQSGIVCPANLRRFHAAVGYGTIKGPYGPYLPNRLPSWHWNCSGENVHLVMAMLLPYVTEDSPKRVKYATLSTSEDVVS